jgi:hypothetical protein
MAQYLPLLFLLACPLMMLFMMRGMHGGHDTPLASPAPPPDTAVSPAPDPVTVPATSARVADLERQVAELHEQLASRPSTANQP